LISGDTLFNEGKYQEAIIYYDKALEIDPSDVYLLANKGTAHFGLSQYQEALYDNVLAIDPNNVFAS